MSFFVWLNMLTLYLHIRKKEKNEKAKYRPVSLLPNLFKTCEKLLVNHCWKSLISFFNHISQKTSRCSALLNGYGRYNRDRQGRQEFEFGAFYTDLFKVLNHRDNNLLIMTLWANNEIK